MMDTHYGGDEVITQHTQLIAHSSQLTAHSPQPTAHSTQHTAHNTAYSSQQHTQRHLPAETRVWDVGCVQSSGTRQITVENEDKPDGPNLDPPFLSGETVATTQVHYCWSVPGNLFTTV